jgi:lipopolysaccharide biosynthesis regulator YciM
MRLRPTTRGLLSLISMQREGACEEDNLEILQSLLQKMAAGKPTYQCNHCGFSGRQIHWQCPSCKQWNTMQPIGGSEGD